MKDSQSSVPPSRRAVTSTAAPTASTMIPSQRRGALFVIAHHPPATPKHETSCPDHDVHAVAKEETNQGDGEEEDRDERDNGESPCPHGRCAAGVTHGMAFLVAGHSTGLPSPRVDHTLKRSEAA